MDRSVRPQDDFYQFANGSWLRATKIPAQKGAYGALDVLSDTVRDQLRTIIRDMSRSDAAPGSDAQKVRDLYESYMDEAAMRSRGLAPLRSDLEKIAQVRSKRQLPKVMAHLDALGVNVPIGLGVGTDIKNSTQHAAYLFQRGLGLPTRDYYFEKGPQAEAVRRKYVTYIASTLKLMGERRPSEKAQQIFQLETALARYHWPIEKTRDAEALYNLRSVAELEEMTPSFAWSDFIRESGISKKSDLVVAQPSYFEGFQHVFDETPLATWRAYLRFRTVDGFASLLGSEFDNLAFDFYSRTLSGVREPEPRWERGVRYVNSALGETIGREYVKRHFPPEAKQRMDDLVQNLMAAMKESLEELRWMSPKTKAHALTKLRRFVAKIGYPEKWEDLSGLDIRPGDALGNARRIRFFNHKRQIGRLNEPVDPKEWHMLPQTVNAYHSPSAVEIVFPAAILQPPAFNMHADDAVNYGAIGVVIGHEMGHAFDDQGRKYDKNGDLNDWWTAEDRKKFQKITAKLVAQFNDFEVLKGHKVNGELTLGENIGDLIGLSVAYRAFQKTEQARSKRRIDGYTPNQRFFLSIAQLWRHKQRPEATKRQLKSDPHAPAHLRVLGPLQHFGPFYKSFRVRKGDPMYRAPKQRAKFW